MNLSLKQNNEHEFDFSENDETWVFYLNIEVPLCTGHRVHNSSSVKPYFKHST